MQTSMMLGDRRFPLAATVQKFRDRYGTSYWTGSDRRNAENGSDILRKICDDLLLSLRTMCIIFIMFLAKIVTCIWEWDAWAKLIWQDGAIVAHLAAVRHDQGRLVGRMEALGFKLREEAFLQTLTQEVVKTCEIEGEALGATQVRSLIARRLGIDIGALAPKDRDVEGIVEVILDATGHYDQALTADRLFGWHSALFPTGRSSVTKILIGQWRDDRTCPMQVISRTLLAKSIDGRTPPSPGQPHPATVVTCLPCAVKPCRTAARTWNSAT